MSSLKMCDRKTEIEAGGRGTIPQEAICPEGVSMTAYDVFPELP